jgi:hypothetical protein
VLPNGEAECGNRPCLLLKLLGCIHHHPDSRPWTGTGVRGWCRAQALTVNCEPCFQVLMGSWRLQLKHLPGALKQPLAPCPHTPIPPALAFCVAFGVQRPYHPLMAHRAPRLPRTQPLAFSFLKIHSQFLLLCCSQAFRLQFE